MIDQRENEIRQRLFNLPLSEGLVLKENYLKAIHIDAEAIHIHCQFGFPFGPLKAHFIEKMKAALAPIMENFSGCIEIQLTCQIEHHRIQHGLKGIREIKNIIAVGSGKGGVGKSTTAVNLAITAAKLGARVGILDADIYGPSLPELMGSHEEPVVEKKRLQPIEKFGLQLMSIGNLVDTQAAMVWRGPMVSSALQQMLNDTLWHDLDYLFIDLPPGTGDIQLTLAQKVPLSGAVIVTTPQDLALLDVRRAIKMFEKVNVPILGVIENMSTFICPNCQHESHLFGHGGGEKISEEMQATFLGKLPLDLNIRMATEAHVPITQQSPHCPISQIYQKITVKLLADLSQKAKDYASKFPKITVV